MGSEGCDQVNYRHMYKEMHPGSLLAALETDAGKWADAFLELTDGTSLSTMTVKGWFEQALRAGHDAGYLAGFNDKRKKPKYMEA